MPSGRRRCPQFRGQKSPGERVWQGTGYPGTARWGAGIKVSGGLGLAAFTFHQLAQRPRHAYGTPAEPLATALRHQQLQALVRLHQPQE